VALDGVWICELQPIVASPRRPKIGLVVPHLTEAGGVSTLARFVKDAILSVGSYDLHIVSLSTAVRDPCNASITRPATWGRGAITSHGTWEGLPIVHVGAIAGELEFQRFRPRRVLAESLDGCDIVQVVSGVPAWANAVHGLNKPVAVQSATLISVERRRLDAEPSLSRAWWQRAMAKVIERYDRRALRTVDAIQVYNPWMLELARELNVGRSVDIRYAPPGIDAEAFRPAKLRALDVDPYVLCVGRLNDPRKNLVLLVESFGRMPEAIRNRVRLVVAGASPPPESFWRRAESLAIANRIAYVAKPSQVDLLDLYQRATAFALPSHEEGLGVVLLEAMACGVPVVTTRSGGPEGIVSDWQDGFLVGLDDAAALAERLTRLCSDPLLNASMGRRARATIEQRYSKSAAMTPYLEMWDLLLSKRKRHAQP